MPRKKKEKEQDAQEKEQEEPILAKFFQEQIITEDSDAARELYNQSRYGIIENNKVYLSLAEALYLLEKNKIEVYDGRRHKLTYEEFLKKAQRLEPNFFIRYAVYKDMRNRGYIIKTALKFGADFRVYDRGIKPGEDHAKWIVFPVHEGSTLTWHDFSAKNRVAHSTRKKLLIGVVDAELDTTYYEITWKRP
ncbi:tRNA-intron lyase [Candidatus Woesearchaeota archaeon]|nr:tRNA-intron lyase [Candidatus Woesearchaeota archaeon]